MVYLDRSNDSEVAIAPLRQGSGRGDYRVNWLLCIVVYAYHVQRIALNVVRFCVIRSFSDKSTEAFFETGRHRPFGTAAAVALRKLKQLDLVERLSELSIPPGNQLEQLKGDRANQHSIRVNKQYRICFRWTEQGPEDVEIVDYH